MRAFREFSHEIIQKILNKLGNTDISKIGDGTVTGGLHSLSSSTTGHVEDMDNPHKVTKSQLGLGNVDNTSDADKPISTAVSKALKDKLDTDGVITGILLDGDMYCLSTLANGDVQIITANEISDYLPCSGGTLGGVLNSRNIVPSVKDTYEIGTVLKPFKNVRSNTLNIVKNSSSYCSAIISTIGTSSTTGVGILIAGNGTVSGVEGNATGGIRIYGESTGYTHIKTGNNTTSNNTLTLPSATGTVALTSDLSNYMPLTGTPVFKGTSIRLTPTTGEGGEIILGAPIDDKTQNGILIDNFKGVFRLFGYASVDGTSKVGTGSILQINPYTKNIVMNHIISNAQEYRTTAVDGYRHVYGNYGFFIRNDGNSVHFLLTNSGDQYGSYNSFRPIEIANSTGIVKINGATMASKVSLGSVAYLGGLHLGSSNDSIAYIYHEDGGNIVFRFTTSNGGATQYFTLRDIVNTFATCAKLNATNNFTGRQNCTLNVGINSSSFSNAPIVLNATNTSARAQIGFHNHSVNGASLYFDTDGRFKYINNGGTVYELIRNDVACSISMNHNILYLGAMSSSAYIRSGSRGSASNSGMTFGINGTSPTLSLEDPGDGTIAFYPVTDAKVSLGYPSFRYANIYSASGVSTTSDRTKKTDIVDLDTKRAKSFIMGLKPSTYEFIDGTSGRTHWGLIAQDIEELMNDLGMDSKDFAGFIKSPKQKMVEVEGENGEKTSELQDVEGEYDYSLRYDEFISPILKVVQDHENRIEELETENQRLKDSLASMEERLKALESKLS